MKRSYSDRSNNFSPLPKFGPADSTRFKSVLPGSYKLKVVKLSDISKPPEKPIDEIEEPEEEDVADARKLDKNNARMIQLDLKDSNNTEIKALETERIECLTGVKPNWTVTILGPVDVRVGNIMLAKKNVIEVRPPSADEISAEQTESIGEIRPVMASAHIDIEKKPEVDVKSVVQIDEDWDDDDFDVDDDCIVLN